MFNKKNNVTIDKIVFGFIILFIISLTNSIFVNQIGYFFALILLVVQYLITRENKFEKNGLELVFILFLTAEFISALFSIDHANAFRNFFKRLVLIPIVYTIAASVNDTERAKLYFKIYLGAALLTMVVYIAIAYEHFIAQLYSIESKGPSPFQYVMTAGGLMSLTTIFLFALLINEKGKLSIRIFYFAAFIISAVGLFSSYTRAAWLGAAAGILTIIIIKRKWVILIPLAALLLFALFFFKNESKIYLYQIKEGKLIQQSSFETKGRASRTFVNDNSIMVADHEKGISVYTHDGKLVQQIETPSPAIMVDKWDEKHFIAQLIDSRILILEKDAENKIHLKNSFSTPGNITEAKTRNNIFYASDLDSGLTIIKNPLNIAQRIHLKRINRVTNFDCDSTWFAAFAPVDNNIKLYSMRDGVPITAVDSIATKSPMGFIWVNNNRLFFQSEDEFTQYVIVNSKIRRVGSQKIKGIFSTEFDSDQIYACAFNGVIYSAENQLNHKIDFKQIASTGISFTDFKKSGPTFYFSFYKRNRLTSFIDPYHESNIERIEQWKTGFKIFSHYPVFGVGDIDLGKIYAQYKDPFLKENFGHLHNNYMQFLVILGVFGFVMVMYMLVKVMLMNLKIYKTLKEIPFVSSYSLGAAAAFVGFLFSGLAEWNFGDQEIITMIWFTLGLNIAFHKSYLKSNKNGVQTIE
ncbi:MAG: O-antigen ligase family protein [Ignavibacteriales bacterium]|nr:O-antigen ligase family protein [Ignavibacteriales bacterium]